jgi:hypothetical protein
MTRRGLTVARSVVTEPSNGAGTPPASYLGMCDEVTHTRPAGRASKGSDTETPPCKIQNSVTCLKHPQGHAAPTGMRAAGCRSLENDRIQPEEEPFAAPLDNILAWREPSDSIELFAGPMSYPSEQVDNLPYVPGRICFWLRSGSHVQWSVDLDAVDPAIAEKWRLPMPDHSLGELRFDFLDRPMTLGAYRQSSGYGFIPGGLGRFGSAPMPVRVIAHWINVPNLRGQTLLGRPATHGRVQRWLGRWEIDLGPWHVMIDSRDDLDQMYRAAKRNHLACSLTQWRSACKTTRHSQVRRRTTCLMLSTWVSASL